MTTMPENKKCVLCKQPIDAAATKCQHCDGYQDWRRTVTSTGALLSALVAANTLLGVGFAIISYSLTNPASDIGVNVVGVVSSTHDRVGDGKLAEDLPTFELALMIANHGNAPGLLQSLHVKIPGDTEFREAEIVSEISEGLKKAIVQAPVEEAVEPESDPNRINTEEQFYIVRTYGRLIESSQSRFLLVHAFVNHPARRRENLPPIDRDSVDSIRLRAKVVNFDGDLQTIEREVSVSGIPDKKRD